MLPSLAWAQSSYRLYTFSIRTDEGENYYEREAKRNFEPDGGAFEDTNAPNRFRSGVGLVNAATGLQIAKRKGSISDLQELLQKNYDWVTTSYLSAVDDLKRQSATFEDDQTVFKRAEVVNYLTLIKKYTTILKGTNPEKFEGAKKNDPGLKLNLVDVTDQLIAAEKAFEESKKDAAEYHYAKGRDLARNMDREGNKEAAKQFRYALEYADNYRDAKDRYNEARKLGTTRLGVSEFENIANSEFGNIGYSISNSILSRFSRNPDEFEFFEVLDRDALDRILAEQKLSLSGLMDESTTAELGELTGVNSILVGKITMATAERERFDPVPKSFSKEVKVGEEKYMDGDKEKTRDIKETVTVSMLMHQKKARATVSATYKILDITTGRLIATDELSHTEDWEGSWYTYSSGDRRAIPAIINRTEVEYIPQSELIGSAADKVADRINSRVASYAKDVSR